MYVTFSLTTIVIFLRKLPRINYLYVYFPYYHDNPLTLLTIAIDVLVVKSYTFIKPALNKYIQFVSVNFVAGNICYQHHGNTADPSYLYIISQFIHNREDTSIPILFDIPIFLFMSTAKCLKHDVSKSELVFTSLQYVIPQEHMVI